MIQSYLNIIEHGLEYKVIVKESNQDIESSLHTLMDTLLHLPTEAMVSSK